MLLRCLTKQYTSLSPNRECGDCPHAVCSFLGRHTPHFFVDGGHNSSTLVPPRSRPPPLPPRRENAVRTNLVVFEGDLVFFLGNRLRKTSSHILLRMGSNPVIFFTKKKEASVCFPFTPALAVSLLLAETRSRILQQEEFAPAVAAAAARTRGRPRKRQ